MAGKKKADKAVTFYLKGGTKVQAQQSVKDKMGSKAFDTRSASLGKTEKKPSAKATKD